VIEHADGSALRRRILRAAEEAFKRSGFRGVTMEAVARDAAVSKATLYHHFGNKDELYQAVCERMAQLGLRSFTDALGGPGTLEQRVAAAVIAKHRLTFTLVRSSPHAEDLFSHKAQLAGELFERASDEMVAHLVDALRAEPELRSRAAQLARVIFFGSAGLAEHIEAVSELESELGAFVALYLAGARGAVVRKSRPAAVAT
jgi:AcrR family transcriptional regulator